jgi:hypothetical protein
MTIDKASGEALDRWGELLGIERKPGETNKDARKRLQDELLGANWMDAAIESSFIKSIPRRLAGDLLFNHVNDASRQLAALREDEIRQIEASGGKVIRIEVHPDGTETLVTENNDMSDKLEEVKPGIYVMDDPQPNIVPGPHMYSDDCHCDNCAGWRDKESAGIGVNIDTMAQEAKLVIDSAVGRWMDGHCKGEKPDPLIRIPCSVVLALCEESKKGHWEDKFDIVAKENSSLRAEFEGIKKKPKAFGPMMHDAGDDRVFVTRDKAGQLAAVKSHTTACPKCFAVLVVNSGDRLPPHCPYCLAA